MVDDATARSFDVTLERGTDGTYLAWVDDLPGLAIRARSRAEVLARLPEAIRAFLAWADPADVPVTVAAGVTEEVESDLATEEDTEALVAADRDPLTREEWTRVRAWLAQSRIELLSLLDRLADDELSAQREGTTRTVREEIEHVAFVELMYAMWTFDLRSRDGLAAFLSWTRRIADERLRELAQTDSADLTWADWGGAPRLEPWTPRKAARRLLWHELLHLRALEAFIGAEPREQSS